ncbi:cupin [Dictyobacter aurantiacus]|uniref:Cupin n=2 Tax=Dictyobacter aurantiacus TaxID=1936993 RepID=A0A401ZLV5_9CHLR|nr:cupin [Dictyobacter aurantiacus]
MHYIIPKEELRFSETTFRFQGGEYGGVAGSFIWVCMPPGQGSKLHRHPYQEVFVLQEGQVTFTIGDTRREISAGNVVVAPANTPHKFTNTGTEPLQMISFHPSSHFIQEYLE